MALRKLALMAVPLALLAAACGGGEEADVTVTMHDDGIELSTSSADAGDLTFEGVNEGSRTHEFEVFIVPEGVDANNLPMDGDVATADETLEVVDEIEDIAPGTSASLSLNLEPGTYAVICNLPGHYANGMHTTFAVA
jgi:uncharacterized cupredoxin-like copper-binding protein